MNKTVLIIISPYTLPNTRHWTRCSRPLSASRLSVYLIPIFRCNNGGQSTNQRDQKALLSQCISTSDPKVVSSNSGRAINDFLMLSCNVLEQHLTIAGMPAAKGRVQRAARVRLARQGAAPRAGAVDGTRARPRRAPTPARPSPVTPREHPRLPRNRLSPIITTIEHQHLSLTRLL